MRLHVEGLSHMLEYWLTTRLVGDCREAEACERDSAQTQDACCFEFLAMSS